VPRRSTAHTALPAGPDTRWSADLPRDAATSWTVTVGDTGLAGAAEAIGEHLGVDVPKLLEAQVTTGFTPKAGAVAAYPLLSGDARELVLVGAGAGTPADLRKAGGAVARRGRGHQRIVAVVADGTEVQAFGEGLVLGSFDYNRKSVDPGPPMAGRIVVTDGSGNDHGDALERGLVVGRAGWRARELATTPSNEKTPAWLAARATAVARASGLEITVWDEKRLAADGFGGILAVGLGSTRPPRLIRLDYTPEGAGKDTPYVVLVGKGITFDSGGLSLKPRESMAMMKRDMTGGGSVIATMSALRALGVKVRVTGLVCAAENMPSGTAYRPDDVVRHYGGRTTEVKNTDAEGRMVLADGLAYAAKDLKPDAIVDIATLTGAIRVSLGAMFYGGMFATDDALADNLAEAGEVSGERLWRMPLPDEYVELISTPIADAVNSSGGPGSITAALFLKPFAGDVPWAHLDLSSLAESTSDEFEYAKGPTGVGARLLAAWLASDHPTAGIGS
jgi:leucyl aminopeptidase